MDGECYNQLIHEDDRQMTKKLSDETKYFRGTTEWKGPEV